MLKFGTPQRNADRRRPQSVPSDVRADADAEGSGGRRDLLIDGKAAAMAEVHDGRSDSIELGSVRHGLTRQGRDFDPLASALADRGWRVICPNLVVRGRS